MSEKENLVERKIMVDHESWIDFKKEVELSKGNKTVMREAGKVIENSIKESENNE